MARTGRRPPLPTRDRQTGWLTSQQTGWLTSQPLSARVANPLSASQTTAAQTQAQAAQVAAARVQIPEAQTVLQAEVVVPAWLRAQTVLQAGLLATLPSAPVSAPLTQ